MSAAEQRLFLIFIFYIVTRESNALLEDMKNEIRMRSVQH